MSDERLARGVAEHFDAFAADYDCSAEWCSDSVLMERLTDDVARKRVLDLGCGTGLLLRKVMEAGGRGTGIDFSMTMLLAARASTGAPLVRSAAEEAAFRGGVFDVIICRQVLHYTREAQALSEIVRLLSIDGELRLAQITSAGPRDYAFWSLLKSLLQPLRRRYYTPDFLAGLVSLVGLEITEISRHSIRRRYTFDDLFCRSPLDAEGRQRVLNWLEHESAKLADVLEPEITTNEVILNQFWTVLRCRRAPRGSGSE